MKEKLYIVTFVVDFWHRASSAEASISIRAYGYCEATAVAKATCALHALVRDPVARSCKVAEVPA